MAYKFQRGQAILSGALDQEGDVDILDSGELKVGGNTVISAARNATFTQLDTDNIRINGNVISSTDTDGNITLTPDGAGEVVIAAGELNYAGTTVLSTGAELNLLDGASAGSVVNNKAVIYNGSGVVIGAALATANDGTIGPADTTDAITLGASEITIKDGVDFSVATVGGFNYGGAAVTATAAELNLLDDAAAGTQVAGKAVIYDASRGINAHGLTGSLRFSLDVEANGGLGMTPFQNSANVSDLKISGSFMDATAGFAPATDSFVALSPSGSVKSFTAQLLASQIAGDGLAASSGVLAVGVDDSTIELDSDALRLKDDGVTGAKLAPAVAGAGLAQDGSGNLDIVNATNGGIAVNANDIGLDFNDLDGTATVSMAADSIAFIDANDSNKTKKESIVDFVSAMAGTGLTAVDGQLTSNAVGTVSQSFEGRTLVEGYNYLTGNLGANLLMLPGDADVGDSVVVKAGDLAVGKSVKIQASGSQRIDGETQIFLESPFAAVQCIYLSGSDGSNWGII